MVRIFSNFFMLLSFNKYFSFLFNKSFLTFFYDNIMIIMARKKKQPVHHVQITDEPIIYSMFMIRLLYQIDLLNLCYVYLCQYIEDYYLHIA